MFAATGESFAVRKEGSRGGCAVGGDWAKSSTCVLVAPRESRP